MKKIITLLALAAFTSSGFAGIIAFDNFNYADGSLVGQGGWASHSGTLGDLLVSGGQAVVQHGIPSEDANLAFASVPGTIYFGLDFTVPSIGAPIGGTDTEYFAHFKDDGNNFAARLDIVSPSAGGDFSVGIASDESTADSVWASDLAYGVTYRAVVSYDQAANIAQLWIDPTTMGDTSIMGEDRPDPGDSITQFALRQSDSFGNDEAVLVDGLVIGTTFNDVAVAVVPEPATYAALLGLLALGFVAYRRRK